MQNCRSTSLPILGEGQACWLVWPWQQCYVIVHSSMSSAPSAGWSIEDKRIDFLVKSLKNLILLPPFWRLGDFGQGNPTYISLQLVNGNHEGNRFAHIKPRCSTLIPPQVSTIIDRLTTFRLTIDAIWSVLNSYNQPSLLNVCSQLSLCEMEGQVNWSDNFRGHSLLGTWQHDPQIIEKTIKTPLVYDKVDVWG